MSRPDSLCDRERMTSMVAQATTRAQTAGDFIRIATTAGGLGLDATARRVPR